MWTSWMVLATCAVITQSFPHSGEYRIPAVPSDRRAQYYVLHDDGDFKYGYDTGEGAYESAVKMGSGELTGFFGYNDAFGEKIRIDYTAGVGGFQPTGNSLPIVPVVKTSVSSAVTTGNVLLKSEAPLPFAPQPSFEEANVKSNQELDGSYSFSYDNSDSSRKETADSSNNVFGEYSFIADDGQNRQIRYRAGSATGYVAEGDSVPVAAPVTEIRAAASAEPTFYTVPLRSEPSNLYDIPTVTTYAQSGSTATQQSFEPRGDSSYSFSYESDGSAREESSDSDLNVKGRYSFVADDGVQRSVNYIAGSSTGFVATGDHLPVAPETTAAESVVSTPIQYSAPARSPPQSVSYQTNTAEQRGDATYQFSYTTDDSSRSESSDSDLNVSGDFSFVADDGQRRTVNYVAGSTTGFLAYGDHLPVAPEVPAARASSTIASSPAVLYSAPEINAVINNEPRGDASYNFNYNADDSSRSESSDSDLNVKGKYTFVADDGIERTVTYRASSGIGFVAEGSHLPVASVGGATAETAVSSGGGSYSHGSSFGGAGASFKSGQNQAVNIARTEGLDGGYSFSYTNSDSSRSESADAANNVIGEYSYTADDGQNRQINYRAGSGIGFIAEGYSIPTVPEVPGAPATSQVYSSPAQLSVRASVSPSVHSPSGAAIESDIQQDGGYSFSYTNSDSSRSETADSSNNVVGQYTFVADDGLNREIRYRAGAATGFVAEGDSIPNIAAVPAVYTASAPGIPLPPAPTTLYNAPVQSPSVRVGSVVSQQSFEPRGDASYSFSYKTDDSTREESSDNDLNVKGRFSFVADDGVQRSVNYIAGSSTGFVATGDHLPVAPETPVGVELIAVPAITQYSAPSHTAPSSLLAVSAIPEQRSDASYHFSYQTDDSDREESADNDLNVKGRFSFVADDGQQRTVNYIAGSSTGFVAEGDHLPKAPELNVPVGNIGFSSLTSPKATTYSGASASSSISSASASEASHSSSGRNDASYSFNYENVDSARDETADSNLSVKGHFKFVADDGVERTVNYIAGSGTGFVAQGAHLPVSIPVDSDSTSHLRSASGSSISTASSSASGSTGYAYNAPATSVKATQYSTSSGNAGTAHNSDGLIVGNVRLHQYSGPGRSKFGYVFNEI